jgi:hypothetical protein
MRTVYAPHRSQKTKVKIKDSRFFLIAFVPFHIMWTESQVYPVLEILIIYGKRSWKHLELLNHIFVESSYNNMVLAALN